jgi:chromosome segregation ATPase
LNTKDQELRLVRHELGSNKSELEQLREDVYQLQQLEENSAVELERLHEHLDRDDVERRKLLEENRSLEERLEMNSGMLSERTNEVNELHAETLELRKGMTELEERNDTLKRQVDSLEEKLRQEHNRLTDAHEQAQWSRTKLQDENDSLIKQIQQLRENMRQLQHERGQTVADRERIHTELLEANTRIQAAESRATEQTRHLQLQLETSKEDLRKSAADNADLRRKQYQFLGQVQKSLRESNAVVVDLRERYGSLQNEMRAIQQNMSHTINSNENNQSDSILRELKTIVQDKNRVKEELQRVLDKNQDLELQIEEIRGQKM